MTELFLILIILAAVFAIIQVFRVKDTFARIINGVLGVAIGVSLIPIPQVAIDGYYLFIIGCLLVILYAFQDSSFTNLKKGLLVGMGALQMIAMIFFIMRWPYVAEIFLSCLLTVFAYLFIVSRDLSSFKNEIGFLTVLMVDGLIKAMMIMGSTNA